MKKKTLQNLRNVGICLMILFAVGVGVAIWRMVLWSNEIKQGIKLDSFKLEDFVSNHSFCNDGSRILSTIISNCDRDGCGSICHGCDPGGPSLYYCYYVSTVENITLITKNQALDICFGEIDEDLISSRKGAFDRCGFVGAFLGFTIGGSTILLILLTACIFYDRESNDDTNLPKEYEKSNFELI